MTTTSKRGGRRPGAGRPKGSGTGPRLAEPLGNRIALRLHATVDAAFRERCAAAEMTPSERVRLLIEADIRGAIKL